MAPLNTNVRMTPRKLSGYWPSGPYYVYGEALVSSAARLDGPRIQQGDGYVLLVPPSIVGLYPMDLPVWEDIEDGLRQLRERVGAATWVRSPLVQVAGGYGAGWIEIELSNMPAGYTEYNNVHTAAYAFGGYRRWRGAPHPRQFAMELSHNVIDGVDRMCVFFWLAGSPRFRWAAGPWGVVPFDPEQHFAPAPGGSFTTDPEASSARVRWAGTDWW